LALGSQRGRGGLGYRHDGDLGSLRLGGLIKVVEHHLAHLRGRTFRMLEAQHPRRTHGPQPYADANFTARQRCVTAALACILGA
jgi:hypothetical protein